MKIEVKKIGPEIKIGNCTQGSRDYCSICELEYDCEFGQFCVLALTWVKPLTKSGKGSRTYRRQPGPNCPRKASKGYKWVMHLVEDK